MKDRNYALVFAYLKKHPYLTKEDVAHEFSGGRTASLKELTDAEYRAMLRSLGGRMQSTEELRTARSSALCLIQRWGVDTTDWARVNQFCEDPRIAGKPFARLRTAELEALTRKLRSMLSRRQSPTKPEPQPTITTYHIIGEA